MGEFRLIEWTTKASKGLENIISRGGANKAKLALQEFSSNAAKVLLEHAENTSALGRAVDDFPDVGVNFRVSNGGRFTEINGKVFIADKGYFQDILNKIDFTTGKINRKVAEELEAVLGIDKGKLSNANEIAMLDLKNVKNFGLKMPTTTDGGKYFIEGGATIGSVPERIIDGPINLIDNGAQVRYLQVAD